MTWDLIKEAMFPGQWSSPITVVYWIVLATLVGLEFFVPKFQDPARSDRWPANFGLGLINMALIPLAPVSVLWASEWAQHNGIGVLNLLSSSWWFVAAIATIAIQSFANYAAHVLFQSAVALAYSSGAPF
jgi:hypothetical protein